MCNLEFLKNTLSGMCPQKIPKIEENSLQMYKEFTVFGFRILKAC